jgi:hypothetical protein
MAMTFTGTTYTAIKNAKAGMVQAKKALDAADVELRKSFSVAIGDYAPQARAKFERAIDRFVDAQAALREACQYDRELLGRVTQELEAEGVKIFH